MVHINSFPLNRLIVVMLHFLKYHLDQKSLNQVNYWFLFCAESDKIYFYIST